MVYIVYMYRAYSCVVYVYIYCIYIILPRFLVLYVHIAMVAGRGNFFGKAFHLRRFPFASLPSRSDWAKGLFSSSFGYARRLCWCCVVVSQSVGS